MKIVFEVFINNTITKTTYIFWGVYKNKNLEFNLFFTPKILYELQHYKYKKSFSLIKKEYALFTNSVENIHYLVKEQLVFGRGGSNKIILDFSGIKKFITLYTGKITICPLNLHNLCQMTKNWLDINSIKFIERDLSSDRLQEYLKLSSTIYLDTLIDEFLNSSNVCYVIELEDNFYYVDHSLVLFKERLKNHKAFNIVSFKRFYSAFIFKDGDTIDSSILENCIHMAASKVLGVNKIRIEKTLGGSGFYCMEFQMREILETALLNPNISFHKCAKRVSHIVLSSIKPIL
jgi:hypothetical protein